MDTGVEDNIEIGDTLSYAGLLDVGVVSFYDEAVDYIDKAQAFEIIAHLMIVFEIEPHEVGAAFSIACAERMSK